ncbi:hypothetical protein EVAR_37708_1 [Eumeta japonica]|uniref:Uncharacterized protein n=1 Tax=Eumeta variegata TaxID=151549 RepID=A0A4C1XSB8_EUMVA|nr:hypothetical protein EVAR_37708_1 [Eumeta japonica]
MSSKRHENLEDNLLSVDIQKDLEGVQKSNFKRKLCSDSIAESSNVTKKHATEDNVIACQNDDIFNFIPQNNIDSSVNDKENEKTLDFLKPQKRKIGNYIDENFLLNQNVTSVHSPEETVKSEANNKESADDMPQIKRLRLDSSKSNSVNISALRGTKLQELKYDGNGWKSCPKIKKENISGDLDSKISHVDLGTTVVMIRKYEIQKRNICSSGDLTVNQIINAKAQNFKKFKKVWPLKTQITY